MKLRTDFVTNSSSSSFFLSTKGGKLTEKQKEIIIDYVEKEMLGKPIAIPDCKDEMELDEYCENVLETYLSMDDMKKLRKLEDKGEVIRVGTVSFDTPDDNRYLYQNLWKKLDGVDGFRVIDGRLYY